MKITRTYQKRHTSQSAFTLIEMMVVICVMMVIIAIAAPAIVSSLQAANENSAAGTLKQVVNSEASYRLLFGNYSPTAAALGGVSSPTGCPAIPAIDGGCFLPNALAVVLDGGGTAVGGYNFIYLQTNAGQGYTMSATPSSSFSGRRAFFVDASGTITYQAGIQQMTAPGVPLGQ